jgi:hypothetical protein
MNLHVLACLCLQSVGLIISGIITATAAHMTEKVRQRNINFAGQSMAAIGAAMTAAAIQQPPHQFTSDACCAAGSSGSASEAGSSAVAAAGSSFKRGEHARGMSVSWDTAAGGSAKAAPGPAGGLQVRITEAGVESHYAAAGSLVSPGADSAAQYHQYSIGSPGGLLTDHSSSWTLQQVTTAGLQASESSRSSCAGQSLVVAGGCSSTCSSPTAAVRRGGEWSSGGGSTCSPDCPANTLNGGRAPAAGAGGYVGSAVADGEVRWLMESSVDQLAQQKDVAAEAQLALAELRSEASVATVGVGRESFGGRVLGQQGSAASSYKASEGKVAGDADGLDLDDADGPGSSSSNEVSWAVDNAALSQPSSMPSSPKRAGAAAGAAGFGNNSSSGGGAQQQQQPGSPSGRASLAVSRSSSSRRGSVAADGGGGVYSVLSELDLSQNPLGATGAKVVAEVRECFVVLYATSCFL